MYHNLTTCTKDQKVAKFCILALISKSKFRGFCFQPRFLTILTSSLSWTSYQMDVRAKPRNFPPPSQWSISLFPRNYFCYCPRLSFISADCNATSVALPFQLSSFPPSYVYQKNERALPGKYLCFVFRRFGDQILFRTSTTLVLVIHGFP